VEAMMLVGLSVTALAFLQLPKNAPLAAIIFWLATASGIGLAGFSFIDPLMASGLARIGFAIAAVLALFTALMLWNRNIGRAGSSMLVWIVVVMWMVLAAVGCLGLYQSEFIESAIAAGVGLILITMSFTLVQLVFGQSIAASHFLEDSGRRALALAGSEQSVWDWQVAHQVLYVGPELERGLGLDPGLMGSINPRKWLELIHPGDRSAYAGAVDAAEKRGKGAFSQEFRLRRADGAYRWYLLRARAIAGEDGFASRLIGTLTDVTAVKRSQDRLLADAVRDRVTGLPNRALFIDRLERAMRRAAARGMDELFVLVIDLDRFKNVNDGLGHEVGDSLLNVTGSRLARMIGPDDTLARLAGDQFGIIFNGETPSREIIAVADNIRQIVAVPINVRPREIFLTASIGVAQFEPGRDDPEELVKNAEIALYEAKRHGKDQIEFFRSDMLDDRSQLVALESDLRRALDRNEIEVVYQPLKRLVDDQLAGFEALVRWRHHELGLLSPDAFMDMAEETGIIREVGRYVLNEATRQLGIWQRAFRPSDPLFVAVNVSRAQLLNYELISDLRALLRREDIVPGTLKLEVTETLVMQNPELASRVLERACDLGVGIACDDFGTGYSALANLARLPFDTLKIDRAFLLEDGTSENATIIFDAITHLAHNLNLNVVAEGVESEEQLERLRRRGVDYAQGFYIGEPVPAKQVIEALGGQPYAPETADSGLSQLWARLLGKQTPADETAADDLPSPEQQAAEVAEMQAQEEILEPWSPDSNDVSDPGIADWPQETQPEPEQYEQPIEEVEADLDQGDVVLPYPPVHEEIIEPETLETQGSTLEPELPQVGTAPLAPRHQPPEPQ
ncbi:MAG TPA: EAL domain-containing protein, partial [Rhizobiales bacterium]|nr:EAL domain-containing protein [Hyphomicrobiales bacterium]